MTQWYDVWPERLEKEKYEMHRRYPSLSLHIGSNQDSLFWKGPILKDTNNEYWVIIEYPMGFPKNSPKVYPLTQEGSNLYEHHRSLKTNLRDYSSHNCHMMGDGSICVAFPSINSSQLTAADVADFAKIWLSNFIGFVETGKFSVDSNEKQTIKEIASKGSIDIESLTIGDLIKVMKPSQVLTATAVLATALASAFAIGAKFF